ncbi:DUF4124 domain-containing protein [bacterium]|nr:DUF4124 domain-containing protein [bacterium]
MLRLFVVILLITLASSSLSEDRADDLYRWQDSSGQMVFGTKPPANAQKLEKLEKQTITRYSSKKLIQAYQPGPTTEPIVEKDVLLNQNLDPNSETPQEVKKTPLEEQPPTEISSPDEKNFDLKATLTPGKTKITHGNQNEITSCKVNVKNNSSIAANKVLVMFEFEDGTTISAAGPEKVSPNEEATYYIPPDKLPVRIEQKKQAGISYPAKPKPKITIQVGA